jgi:hypothetical protein
MQLYLVRLKSEELNEEFLKVGVTRHEDPTTRFSYGKESVAESSLPLKEKVEMLFAGKKYIPDLPYDVEVIHSVRYNLDGDALLAERELLGALAAYKHWPSVEFSGRTECFKGDDAIDLITRYMNEDSGEKNKEAPNELTYKLHETRVRESDPIKRHLLVLNRCKK